MYDFVAKSTQFQTPATLPTKIIYPAEYFPVTDPEWQEMIDEFVGVLENFLGSERNHLSIVRQWESSKPESVKEPDVRKYLERSGFWPYCYEFFHSFKEFQEQAQDKLGRKPYAAPGVKYRWYVESQI